MVRIFIIDKYAGFGGKNMRSAYLSGLNMHPAYLYPSNYAGMAAVKDEIRRRQKKWYISTI